MAFAGHRDTFFRPLKDIRGGDRIVVTTPEGEFAYVVRETRVVAPTDVSVLDPTPRPTLPLVTCHPFNFVGNAPNRFIVRAEQTEAATPAAGVSTPQPPAPITTPSPTQAAAVAATAGHATHTAVAERPREPRKVSARKPARAKAKATGTKAKATGAKQKKSKRNPFRAFLRLFR